MIFGNPPKAKHPDAAEQKDSPAGRKTPPERPVYSPEAERDFLDTFLEGDEQKDREKAQSKKPAPAGDEPVPTKEGSLEEAVVGALREIYDPEIPVNIYDLGLIYDVDRDADDNLMITMTLTSPHCPVAETLPEEVRAKAASVEGAGDVDINLVWDPPWDPSRMTEEAKLELGFL